MAERPEIKDSLNSLTEALGSASELIQQAKLGLGPALEKLAPTLERAQQAMIRMNTSLNSLDQGYGKSSSFKRDMTRLISQINDTMRSFRVIADYLQQHPEALIRGKTGTN